MTELNWTLSWTLVTIGLCWLFISCAVALALGRIIQRGKAGRDPMSPHLEELGVEDESELDEGGSRAASGTRLKAVRMDDHEAGVPERKVS